MRLKSFKLQWKQILFSTTEFLLASTRKMCISMMMMMTKDEEKSKRETRAGAKIKEQGSEWGAINILCVPFVLTYLHFVL